MKPGTLKLVLVPAIVTLAVTLLRLLGELRDWDRELFSTEPGGNGAIFGIVWLVPIFGAYFGFRLAQAGYGPRRKLASLLSHVAALALLVGAGIGTIRMGVEFPEAGYYVSGAAWLFALIPLFAWPALFRVNLVYGLLARIPVVVVTYIAVKKDWGTHYEKLGPENLRLPEDERAFFLSLAQIGFWLGFTIIAGGLFGSLAALFGRSRPPA